MSKARDAKNAPHESVVLLTDAKRLETGRIYESGARSRLAEAYVRLSQQRDAENLFQQVFEKSSTNVGKIYALLGIYQRDKDRFASMKHSLNADEKVSVLWFGLGMEYKVSDLLRKIEDGTLQSAVANLGEQR